MIKVVYNNGFKNIKITGHAGYADLGKDVVCACASGIILSSVNLAMEYNANVKYTREVNKKEIINDSNDENVEMVFKNMIVMLEDLQKQYPKNIKISKGE